MKMKKLTLIALLLNTALSNPSNPPHKNPRSLDFLGLDLDIAPDLDLEFDFDLNHPTLQGYRLTWHDEFTSSHSPTPSTTNWLFTTGTSYPGGASNWGNNELQTYTTSPTNLLLTPSGTLTITPRHNPETGQWTSARIETRRTDFSANPGGKLLIESRLRTGCAPAAQQRGIWPAFWALGGSFRDDYTNWPMASEWDFVEVVNGESVGYSTVHCGRETAEGGPCREFGGLGNGGVEWEGCVWHEVLFEVDRSSSSSSSSSSGSGFGWREGEGEGDGGGDGWREEKLRWYIDGNQVWEVSGADVGEFDVWEDIAHQGHFLLLNVAVGGNWPGYPNEQTVDGEEVQLEVDYVRVWNSD